MKLLMLLALAGLASCSTTLIGGDRARDVSLRYKYYDDDGKEIQVEVEAERLGLGLVGAAPRKAAVAPAPAPAPAARRAPAPAPAARRAPVSAVPYSAPTSQARTRFVSVEAASVGRVVEVAPAPQVTRFVQAEAPRTRYVKLDDDDDDDYDEVPVVFHASAPVAPPAPIRAQRLTPLRSSVAAIDRIPVVTARRISFGSDEQ